jgi:hypothetical protein
MIKNISFAGAIDLAAGSDPENPIRQLRRLLSLGFNYKTAKHRYISIKRVFTSNASFR